MIGELSAVAAAILWAIGSLLFGRIGRDGVPPGAMNLGKLIVAGSLLAITALALTGHVVPMGAPTSALVLLALSGVAGLTIGDTAYFGSIVALGVPRAILLLSSAPVFDHMEVTGCHCAFHFNQGRTSSATPMYTIRRTG